MEGRSSERIDEATRLEEGQSRGQRTGRLVTSVDQLLQ
jgi:hypothetical protein